MCLAVICRRLNKVRETLEAETSWPSMSQSGEQEWWCVEVRALKLPAKMPNRKLGQSRYRGKVVKLRRWRGRLAPAIVFFKTYRASGLGRSIIILSMGTRGWRPCLTRIIVPPLHSDLHYKDREKLDGSDTDQSQRLLTGFQITAARNPTRPWCLVHASTGCGARNCHSATTRHCNSCVP